MHNKIQLSLYLSTHHSGSIAAHKVLNRKTRYDAHILFNFRATKKWFRTNTSSRLWGRTAKLTGDRLAFVRRKCTPLLLWFMGANKTLHSGASWEGLKRSHAHSTYPVQVEMSLVIIHSNIVSTVQQWELAVHFIGKLTWPQHTRSFGHRRGCKTSFGKTVLRDGANTRSIRHKLNDWL